MKAKYHGPLKNKKGSKNTKPWLGAVYSENILEMDCCIQKKVWKWIAVLRKHFGNELLYSENILEIDC